MSKILDEVTRLMAIPETTADDREHYAAVYFDGQATHAVYLQGGRWHSIRLASGNDPRPHVSLESAISYAIKGKGR